MTDRDKLIELLNEAQNEWLQKEYDHETEKSLAEYVADYLLANGVILQKQGEWKETKEPLGWQDIECVECSACRETWILDEDFDFEFCKEFWKYCPKCGARMEREGK